MAAKSTYQFVPDLREIIGCSFISLVRILGLTDASYQPQPDAKPSKPPRCTLNELDCEKRLLVYSKYVHTDKIKAAMPNGLHATDWVTLKSFIHIKKFDKLLYTVELITVLFLPSADR